MLIDTHAHLNFRAFDKDRNWVIKNCLKQKVWMINVGSNFSTSRKAVEIAKDYKEGIWAAIGLHPIHLETGLIKIKNDDEETGKNSQKENFFDYEKYKDLAKSEKVVAIGETGLDYYWKPKTKNKLEEFKKRQKETLLEQLKLAGELNLPVIFHCRMAHQELIEILSKKRKVKSGKIKGAVHCFTGNLEQAKKYLEMGLHLGFNGIIFKLDLDKIIKKTPLEKILLETDCPYLSVPGYKKRNDPLGVKLISQKIAKIKKISVKNLVAAATHNAQNLFLTNKGL